MIHDNLISLFELYNAENEKFSQGNKAAGTRVRKGMQDLKTVAQGIRVEVQSAKNEG